MRISKPVRSSKCTHLQCFDARWWLESNKSHPQWLCPHCSKELKFDEIICDGYFLSILNAVPDSYDEVTLESNGDWHTNDAKYGSAEWMAANGSAPPPPAVATPVDEKPIIKRSRSASADSTERNKRRAIEILSDSEDEAPPRATANGHANGIASANGTRTPASARSTAPPQPAIIDLTLSDSDDDEPAPHFPRPGGPSTSLGVAGSGPRPATATAKLPPPRDVPLYAQALPSHVHLPQPIYSPKTVQGQTHQTQPYNAHAHTHAISRDIPPSSR